ncbi:MAG TPA: carbon storage regulator CsrA [Phycisphaerae bacterium]|nr:carbon storage regulator CsrA [Phycisphaerae bacterium]
MLVLSRQRDETIMIGDEIQITVVDIRGEKVRLGINAPPHVPVHRKEVYDAIKREKEAEAGNGHGDVKVESLANRKHPHNGAPAGH